MHKVTRNATRQDSAEEITELYLGTLYQHAPAQTILCAQCCIHISQSFHLQDPLCSVPTCLSPPYIASKTARPTPRRQLIKRTPQHQGMDAKPCAATYFHFTFTLWGRVNHSAWHLPSSCDLPNSALPDEDSNRHFSTVPSALHGAASKFERMINYAIEWDIICMDPRRKLVQPSAPGRPTGRRARGPALGHQPAARSAAARPGARPRQRPARPRRCLRHPRPAGLQQPAAAPKPARQHPANTETTKLRLPTLTLPPCICVSACERSPDPLAPARAEAGAERRARGGRPAGAPPGAPAAAGAAPRCQEALQRCCRGTAPHPGPPAQHRGALAGPRARPLP